MKVLVISDSHGHVANIKHVMEFAKNLNVKAVIHCGDWHDIKSVETLLSYKIPLYAVMGNADIEDDIEEYLKFNAKKFEKDFLKFELDGRKIGVIHQVKNDDKRFESLNALFSGHFHSKEEKMINFTRFVRPGALINGINFAVYETNTNQVEFIHE